jgi:hypothetical protein
MLFTLSKLFALLLIASLGVVLILATRKPDVIDVHRTASIQAAPERIVPLLSDFHSHAWGAWSPYETKDPDMKRTLSGAANGVGAVYEWQGDNNIGHGRMQITAVTPSKVTIQLDFFKPLQGRNIAEFTLEPAAGVTQVTWSMRGPATYLSKLMSVFLDMDRMIGTDFEAGLAKLKTLAEQPA